MIPLPLLATMFLGGGLWAAAQERPVLPAGAGQPRGGEPVAKAVTALSRKAGSKNFRYALWPDGTLRSVTGLGSAPYAGKAESAARRFVEENPAVFGPGPRPDLEPVKSIEILGMRTVWLRQIIDGYPVLGQEVVLNMSAANSVEGIQARYVSSAIRKGAWNADRGKAIAAARAHKTGKPAGEVKAERAWRVEGAAVVPVWMVRFSTGDGDWQMLVSADSGKVVETKNLRGG